jgi:hypothetical protein
VDGDKGFYQLPERSTRSIIHRQFIPSLDAWIHPPIPKAHGHIPRTSHANLPSDAPTYDSVEFFDKMAKKTFVLKAQHITWHFTLQFSSSGDPWPDQVERSMKPLETSII